MTQAYDKDGNKIPFAVYKGDIVRGFQTVEQYEAQIATLTAENERLRLAVKLAMEIHLEGLVDFEEYGLTCDGDIYKVYSAALQPKEGE